ncbi:uncharacterized protein LOC144450576 [Glandiceps talaboti]
MAFPLRRTRRLVQYGMRIFVFLIVVTGIATLIGHMYMLNDDYANELSEKRLNDLISKAKEERTFEDVKREMEQALDFEWPTSTVQTNMQTEGFFEDMEQFGDEETQTFQDELEEKTTDFDDVADTEMTGKLLDDELNEWFGITTTTGEPVSTVVTDYDGIEHDDYGDEKTTTVVDTTIASTTVMTSSMTTTEATTTVTMPFEITTVATSTGDDFTDTYVNEDEPSSIQEQSPEATESSFAESEQIESKISESNVYDEDWEYSFDQETASTDAYYDALTDQMTTTDVTQMMFTYNSRSPGDDRQLEVNYDEDEQEDDTMDDVEYPKDENDDEVNYPQTDDVMEDEYDDEREEDTYDNGEDYEEYESEEQQETEQEQSEEDEAPLWQAPPVAEPITNFSSNIVQRPQYILPVFRGIGQGPNNQYLAFKAVVLYAMMHNKTVVLPPFFNHHRITEDDVRTFEETFNSNLLGGIVRVATLDEFRRDCHNKVDAVLYTKPCVNPHSCYFDSIYRTMIPIFEILTGIKFPSKESFEDGDETKMPITMLPTDPAIFTHESIYDYLYRIKDSFRTDSECAAMFYPFPFMKLMMRAYSNDIYMKLEQHLARALYIRKMADHFIRTTMENRPFMAVHWRLNYDFKIVWCGRRVECRWGCQYIYKRNSSEEITSYFVNIMQAFNLSAIYFASPPMQRQRVWDNVRTKIPYAFNSTNLLSGLRDLDVPELTSPLEDDNYIISLIEQELCYRASMFIGTAVSTWSYMVEQQRIGRGTLFMPDVFGDPDGKCR